MIRTKKIQQVIPLFALLALSACGGGSSSDISADPASAADTIDEFGLGPTAPEIQAMIDAIEVEQFAGSDGITFEVVQYYLHDSMFPGFFMRVNNDSSGTIENAGCTVQAFRDGSQVNFFSPGFGSTIIDPGESAIGSDHMSPPASNFSDYDQLVVRLCSWSGVGGEFDRRRDITTGPITVDFLGYSSSSTGRPQARLLLTNNSDDTISNARCDLDAKVGRTIVAVGSTSFDDADDIAPGEAEETELVLRVNSLASYDSEPFDISNLNCTYTD